MKKKFEDELSRRTQLYPLPPTDFDPMHATNATLAGFGLPPRPDAETDPDLSERIASLQRSSRDILERYPAEDIVPEILKRSEAEAVSMGPVARKKPARRRLFGRLRQRSSRKTSWFPAKNGSA